MIAFSIIIKFIFDSRKQARNKKERQEIEIEKVKTPLLTVQILPNRFNSLQIAKRKVSGGPKGSSRGSQDSLKRIRKVLRQRWSAA